MGKGKSRLRRDALALAPLGLLLAPTTARAMDPELTTDTTAQFYDVRSPSGETVLARRRLTTTLGVGVYDLLEQPRPDGPQLLFRARMRYDADYGASGAETQVTNFGRVVPGYDRNAVDLMYGYVEGRRFLKGWLGFKLGRQYVTDALGWWSFDGGSVRVTTPYWVAGEVYVGLEQRGGMPLSQPRFERDGIWRGNRDGYDPALALAFQANQIAPALGVAAETAGIPWFHGRVTYRHVSNTGPSYVSVFNNALYTGTQYDAPRISQERVGASFDGTLPNHGGVKGGLSYDLYMTRLATLYTSVDAFLTKKLTASLDYDFYQPSYDADSIWNFFQAAPMNDIGLRGSYDATDKLSIAGGTHLRIFANQTEADLNAAGRPDASPNLSKTTDANYYDPAKSFNGGGDASARYRWGEGLAGVRASGNLGKEGDRVGFDAYGERILAVRYVVNGRAGLWHWNDKARADRAALGANYMLGAGYVLAPKSRLLVEFDHNINRISGNRFRLMLWLTVAVSK